MKNLSKYIAAVSVLVLGCAGNDGEKVKPDVHHGDVVAPNLAVEIDAGPDATNSDLWGEKCDEVIGDHVFASHAYPGLSTVEIYEQVVAYPALDIPVEISEPLAAPGLASYDCGEVGNPGGYPMIIFAWRDGK